MKIFFKQKFYAKAPSAVFLVLVVGTILVFLGVFLNFFFIGAIKNIVFEHRMMPFVEHIQEHAKIHLVTNDRFDKWPDEESQYHVDELYSDITASKEILEFNIFNKQAVYMFSSEGEGVGETSDNKDVKAALNGQIIYGEPSADELYESHENSHEDKKNNLKEVYIPVKSEDGNVKGVVEVYYDESHLTMLINNLQRQVIISVLLSIFLVSLIVFLVLKRQNLKQAIKNREFSSIVEHSPIGIYTVDQKGTITFFNPKMCEISGCKDPNERIGLNVFQLHSYEENNLDEYFHKGLRGERFEVEVRHVSQSDKESFRHYRGVPLFDLDSEDVTELLLLVEDVTERKKMETKLENYTKSLEITVSARTRELEERLKEMSRLNQITVDRELKMIELKKENKELRDKLS